MNVQEPTSLGTVAINSSPHVTLSEGSVRQETNIVGRLAHSRLQFS